MNNILNIFLRTDRDFVLGLTQYSEYCNGSGTIAPFTGTEYVAQIRQSLNNAAVVLTLDIDETRLAEGVITITKSADDLAAIPTGEYVWDLLEVNGSQKVNLVEGVANIKGTVSRTTV
jgi:hypothetical protein